MAIGAARVMAAGKAGLESLPFFVDELMAQGIPQLAPWAADHLEETGGKTDLQRLRDRTQDRLDGDWKGIFDLRGSALGIEMHVTGDDVKALLQRINPLAADDAMQLADSPAQLGVWCRLHIEQHCHGTYEMWDRYKAEKGYTGHNHHLAVVIPYCPEGPTSGTVAMYLGARLRRYFEDKGKIHELMVWGIEICPSLDNTDSGNAFRGYVARKELLNGVPLSKDSNDETLHHPFDINIVFDGGNEQGVSSDTEDYVHEALDRVAAQGTASLLNGAADKSNAQANAKLKQGRRWNAFVKHVVSERSYGDASRYMSYQATLPWYRNREEWDNGSTIIRREAFLRRIDGDIKPRIQYERNEFAKRAIGNLISLAEGVRSISLTAKWNNFMTKARQTALKEVDDRLAQAVKEDADSYNHACQEDPAPDAVTLSAAPFCINLKLPDGMRRDAAREARDSGIATPVVEMLGDSGSNTLRSLLTARCEEAFKRSDCDSQINDSSAFFHTIIAISMCDLSTGNRRLEFNRAGLDYLLSIERRGAPDSLLDLAFDLSDVMRAPTQKNDDTSPQPVALKWRLSRVPYEIPVEYTLMVLGRVQEDQGFRDITTYQRLEATYNRIVGDSMEWRERARYYGVKPPPELLRDDDALSPGTDASVNGHPVTRRAAIGGDA